MDLLDPLLGVFHRVSDFLFSRLVFVSANRFASNLNVPPHFLVHLFSIEDKRFLLHPGVDPIAMVRAAASNIAGNRLQGASTITQQLYHAIRQCKGLRRERTIKRKLRQITWAVYEDACYPKEEILDHYLGIVYWGRSYFGVDAAAHGYFNSKKSDLSVAQSFFLVERLARPNSVSLRRVESLLQRPPIALLFATNATAIDELVALYEKHFNCGGIVWRHSLAKFRTKSDTPIVKFWSDVSNVQ